MRFVFEVKDPSGAAMKASGELQGLNNGVSQAFQTDDQGKHTVGSLPYGRYRLEISRDGFATQSMLIEVQSAAPVLRSVAMVLSPQAATVSVIAATPLVGSNLPIDQIPAPVQTATAHDIEQSGALDLSDLLNRRLSGVYINENQENPFQPDVNYRGYTASPLLGTPEGLSVYMDGVRQNQPFGDIVAWDLIPKIAISEVALIPGSNPLFGLNTLGGALSIETKDGESAPGSSIQVSGGSFGRRAVEFENGGSISNGLNWYVAGNLFHEDGWRVDSPSDVRQAFTKLGWQRGNTAIFLSGGYADNQLTGNGLQDFRFLSQNYSSVYSIPDINWDRSPSLNLSVRRSVNGSLSFSGNAYFRFIRSDTNNADINSESFDESLYNPSAAPTLRPLLRQVTLAFQQLGIPRPSPFPFGAASRRASKRTSSSRSARASSPARTAGRPTMDSLGRQLGLWLTIALLRARPGTVAT